MRAPLKQKQAKNKIDKHTHPKHTHRHTGIVKPFKLNLINLAASYHSNHNPEHNKHPLLRASKDQ